VLPLLRSIAMDNLFQLLKKLSSLERAPRTVKGDYPAPKSPYKPILLLTVLWRIHRGVEPYARNEFRFDLCLKDFSHLYSRVYGNSSEMKIKATQAFWYLGTGKPKVWDLVAKPGQEDELIALSKAKIQIKTAPKLNRLVASARFAPEDWQLLQDPDVQRALISFLIAEQFTDVRQELERL
jgi:predicted restriction endonuclease